ncbi:MAG: YSIRK-type signal peptide-containing protein, partial [Anaerococcus sp.]|nr:YSIRK-type signal peptide-containing protein [Anaerococcus sp.]
MSNKKAEILRFIEHKKEKGSLRKPRYATRKLSIGLVSCMLGFTLLVSPTETFAAEQAGNEMSEGAEEIQPNEAQDQPTGNKIQEEEKKADEINVDSGNDQTIEANIEEGQNQEDSLKDAKDAAKAKIASAYDKAKEPAKSLEEYNQEIDSADSEEAIDAIVSEVEALEPKTEDSEDKAVNEDENSTDELPDNNLGISGEIEPESQGNPQETPNADDEDQTGDVEADFNQTQIKATINAEGLNGKDFNFEKIFGNKTIEVQLVNKSTGEVIETKTIDTSATTEVVFDGTYSMDDVEAQNYQIELVGSGAFDGNSTSVVRKDATNGWSSGLIDIYQVRNRELIVETKNEDAEDPEDTVNNPTTENTGGKLELKPNEGTLRSNEPIDIPETSDPVEIGPRQNRMNKEVYDKGFTIKVEGTEAGYLVDKENNKVYKPEVTVDPNGFDPSKIVFTEKDSSTTDNNHANDEDRVTVTFDAGLHGTIEAGKTYYVIKGVTLKDGTIVPPTVVPNIGWRFIGWDIAPQNKYDQDTTHTAQYEAEGDVIPGDEDKPAGYVTVTFAPGEHGTLEGTTSYHVNPEKEVTLTAPTVKANTGYEFASWNAELTGTFTEDTTITATYNEIGDVIPGGEEKPEGYVTVTFAPGENGEITSGETTYYVNPENEVILTAPTVKANTGW